MGADLALSIRIVRAVASVPSLLARFSEARLPRLSALLLVFAGGLIVWAVTDKPGGYTVGDMPGVLISAIARYIP